MCQRVIELDSYAAELERKARQEKKKLYDKSILEMLNEVHEKWKSKPNE